MTEVSTKKDQPKKRGRPATGKDPMVGFRASPALTTRLDAFADEFNITRAEAIRRFVEKGLSGR
jgi:predicted DNA-binding protein